MFEVRERCLESLDGEMVSCVCRVRRFCWVEWVVWDVLVSRVRRLSESCEMFWCIECYQQCIITKTMLMILCLKWGNVVWNH